MIFDREPRDVPLVATAYRRIQTPIPAPGTRELLERLEACEARSMQGMLPLVWDRAEGFSIYDTAGNQWIDFTSAAFLTNVGHANQRVVAAVRDAINHPLIHSYVYVNEIRIRYQERLIEWAGAPFTKSWRRFKRWAASWDRVRVVTKMTQPSIRSNAEKSGRKTAVMAMGLA